MQHTSSIHIDFDKVLVALFCCYAFSIPYELILEILLGIDTIFKPFRILSIIIIGVFGIKVLTQGLHLDKNDRADWFLYGVFIYGVLISCYKMITGVFNMGLFINDSFQFSLHLATFFIYKSTPISKAQALKIFNWFMIGILLNSVYLFYLYTSNMNWGRQTGFTDNPNYVSFGLVAVIAFLLVRSNFKQIRQHPIWTIFTVSFSFFIFIIAGSRTGFVMFLIVVIFIFFFSNLRRKIILSLVSVTLIFMLLPNSNTQETYSLPLVKRLIKSVDEKGEDVRFIIWRGIFRVLESEGYEGMGIGQFKANFPKYFSEESEKLILEITNYGYYLSPHNDYLAIVTDYGLPSLLFYLLFLGTNFWTLLGRTNYHYENKNDESLAQFSFILFSCIIIFGLTSENFHHQLYWFLLMFTTKKYW